MTMRPTPRMTAWTWKDTVSGILAILDFLIIVFLWGVFLYNIFHGNVVWVIGAGFALVINSIYDIRNKEGGRVRPY